MSRNTTATGGYLKANPQAPALVTTPPGLTFVQFIQSVLVGLSGFNGDLVRPEWQPEQPKQPDLKTDWLAFGLGSATPDNNAYVAVDGDGNPTVQRNELIPIIVSVYGPNAYDNVGLIRDGFQLTQNLTNLRAANVGFAYDTPAQHVPDFFNERWFDRWRMEIYVRRQINRVYPILIFASASGTIYGDNETETPIVLPFAASGE